MLKLLLICSLSLFMGSLISGCVVVTGATVEGPTSIKVKVAVPQIAMSANHQIQPTDYKLEERTLDTCPTNSIRNFDQITGKKSTKPIKVGQILTLQDIE